MLTTATGDPEPAPRRCDPSAVSGQRVLRCPRLGPGEIRDAAPGPCGQADDFPSGQGVWFLAAVVLPSRIQFRTKWLVWIASWEARSRSGHKLTPEVMQFVVEQRSAEPSLSFAQLAEAVKRKFNLRVHPRSIERQLLREKKRQ